jgi:hypothetical protein
MVEAATFGSEMVALRICNEFIVAMRYKLRMFGVPIEGPANVFCDNHGVVKNTSMPESTLTKKHNAINYHVVREAVAAGILRVGKEDGEMNLADLLTKVIVGQKRWDFVGVCFLEWSNSQVILMACGLNFTSQPIIRKERMVQ